MDTLTVAILVIMLLVLVAPIIEIAVKRPKTFLEMTADMRAFADAPLHESAAMRWFSGAREVEDVPVDDDRLAGSTSRVTASCGGRSQYGASAAVLKAPCPDIAGEHTASGRGKVR